MFQSIVFSSPACDSAMGLSTNPLDVPVEFESCMPVVSELEGEFKNNGMEECVADYGSVYPDGKFLQYILFVGTDEDWKDPKNLARVFLTAKGIFNTDEVPEFVAQDDWEMDNLKAMKSFEDLSVLEMYSEDFAEHTDSLVHSLQIHGGDGAGVYMICSRI